MIGSLWTGISGLAGSQIALDNESNNIANVNTIGFKASRISFADQMYQNNIGKGTQILDAEKMYIQGNLKTTGVSYDVALSGDGFFAVSNTRGGGTAETFYTRAGNFRMGDSGTLQDTIGNEVQGWAMGSNPKTTSSNPNVSKFTNDYTKLLSSKIIQYSNAVETITAKATDYTLTAKSDDATIFTGSGLKTKYGKISDVEALVKAYTTALQNLKANPDSSSASAKAQLSHIDLPGESAIGGTFDTGAVAVDGDAVYVYIDGGRISQPFLPADATATLTAKEAGYIKTMKAFADQISAKPGLKAYVTSPTLPYDPSTKDADILNGTLKIESIIPGQSFTISSVGMTSNGGTDKPGTYGVDSAADAGKGVGALETIKSALNQAISGKQTDVYTTADDVKLSTTATENDFTYQISIYSNALGQNVLVPSSPLVLANMADVDAMVAAINNPDTGAVGANTLPTYVRAYNINGSLVIKTLDSNFDVEFSGDLKRTTASIGAPAEKQTVAVTGTATAAVSFLGTAVTGSVSGDTATQTVARIIADKAALMLAWNTANPAKEIADITASGTTLTVTYKTTEGDVPELAAATSSGIAFAAAVETAKGGIPVGDVKRNASYSGREGAGAEFIEIITRVDQTASKGSLQLRLDTLGISDSAFGDFSVDSTGLITMTQDGAMFAVGQMAIAKFITNRGLEPSGNNLLKSTLASGEPIYNLNNDKTAEVKANTLELSTADLSESLVSTSRCFANHQRFR
ncbi:MAG: flagellar hook-basal body complex protein [Arcobacter sp.]|nr:flagellar hook-basal body complex protein [Arcobacter sp.]